MATKKVSKKPIVKKTIVKKTIVKKPIVESENKPNTISDNQEFLIQSALKIQNFVNTEFKNCDKKIKLKINHQYWLMLKQE